MQATRQRAADIPSLSSAEVRQRIQSGDSNDYEARVGRSYWDIFRDNVLNLFNLVLGTLLVIVIGLGDYATAFFAGFSVVTNTFFGMLQEFKRQAQARPTGGAGRAECPLPPRRAMAGCPHARGRQG